MGQNDLELMYSMILLSLNRWLVSLIRKVVNMLSYSQWKGENRSLGLQLLIIFGASPRTVPCSSLNFYTLHPQVSPRVVQLCKLGECGLLSTSFHLQTDLLCRCISTRAISLFC